MDREQIEDKLAREQHAEILERLTGEEVVWRLAPTARALGLGKEDVLHLALSEGEQWAIDRLPDGRSKLRGVDDEPSPGAVGSQGLGELYGEIRVEVDHGLAQCGVGRAFGLGCDVDKIGPGAIADLERMRLGHSTRVADIERERQAKYKQDQIKLAADRTPAAFFEELGPALMADGDREKIRKAAEQGDVETLRGYLVNLSIVDGPSGQTRVAEVRLWHHRDWPVYRTQEQAKAQLGMGGRQISAADLYQLVGSRERLRVRFGKAAHSHPSAARRFIGPEELSVDSE